ncbi:MAG: DUF4058 family protein [Planctomycetales bacterium]|nr:DUF4058 family protein [Planctomycetales bacterium]
MNPFLEVRWPDAHTVLIAYVRDVLSNRLPDDLTIIAEESVSIGIPGLTDKKFRADVAVAREPQIRIPSKSPHKATRDSLVLAKPVPIRVPLKHRWLEIRDLHDHLITVIEILSPSKKTLWSASEFARRGMHLLASGINTLDIDLIRGGVRALPDEFRMALSEPDSGTTYLVVAGRAGDLEQRDVYYCPLQEELPVVAVPLRSNEEDVPLELQPLVNRCYETGRYWQISHRALPDPALTPDEQVWMDQLRTEAGLIN